MSCCKSAIWCVWKEAAAVFIDNVDEGESEQRQRWDWTTVAGIHLDEITAAAGGLKSREKKRRNLTISSLQTVILNTSLSPEKKCSQHSFRANVKYPDSSVFPYEVKLVWRTGSEPSSLCFRLVKFPEHVILQTDNFFLLNKSRRTKKLHFSFF